MVELEKLSDDEEVGSNDGQVDVTTTIGKVHEDALDILMSPGSQNPVQDSLVGVIWEFKTAVSITVFPGMTVKTSLGIHLAIPPHHCLFLTSRPLLAAEGITAISAVIDANHRGVIHSLIHNLNQCVQWLTKGERVCLGLIIPLPRVRFVHGDLGADAHHRRTGGVPLKETEGGGD